MISNDEVLKQLGWRYATKKFDATKRLTSSQWEALEKALILTPSSYGFQPWQFWVITNQDMKKKLRAASYNQPQVEDCSHFLVFAAKKQVTEKEIENFVDYICQVRNLQRPAIEDYRKVIAGDLLHGPRSKMISEWAARQTYIALGNLMTCAAILGIDTCPMEGINPPQFDEILSLKDTGYATAVACAVGFRNEQDPFSKLAKVRYPASQIIKLVE